MPRGTREFRHGIVIEVQSLILGGASDAQVYAHLMKKHEQTGVPRFSSKTARRYLKLAYAQFNREAKRTNKVWLSVGLAKRAFAQRRALQQKKFMIVAGQLRELDDPDIATYLASVESEAKLLGLNAPERHELVVESFRQMFLDLVLVLREEVHDQQLLMRIVTRLRAAMEGGQRDAMRDNALVGAATIIEATKVVDAGVVIDASVITDGSPSVPPHSSNGVNGTTNGHAP